MILFKCGKDLGNLFQQLHEILEEITLASEKYKINNGLKLPTNNIA